MRHRFHSICPYFAIFPEQFVAENLVWSKPGDVVFDPFSGRGTTVLESLLRGRRAAGVDTNPVAVCLSNAKADPPPLTALLQRIRLLARRLGPGTGPELADRFFNACFHPKTLHQLLALRASLEWRTDQVDRFIAAMVLGLLHGESHRSGRYFSNRMPRTISTKPGYSIRWWREHGCSAPERDVFEILLLEADFRYRSAPPELRGWIAEGDCRGASGFFPELVGKVGLVVTSPPYLDTTDFGEDQWLRLWFLGGPTVPHRRRVSVDDRHRSRTRYWTFLEEAWRGLRPLLRDGAHVVVRIGGKKLTQDQCRAGLESTMKAGIGHGVELVDNRASKADKGQLRVHQPKATGSGVEYDHHFVFRDAA